MALTALEQAARPLPPLPLGDSRLRIPTLSDVFKARKVVDRYLFRTPVIRPEPLSARLGFDLALKCENVLPTGAFKVRGGLYLLSQLDDAARARGVVTASTGNHGQSIAYAAREFGARAIIYVPENANPVKVESMRLLGAEVVHEGPDFDACREAAGRRAEQDEMYFVHSANEQALIAGVATYTLELLEAIPDLDVLLVPAGGGSGLCGALVAGKAIKPDLEVIGVQSIGAPVVAESWKRRSLLSFDRVDTFAEGVATRVAFELPAHIIWDRVDDFVLVSDGELRQAMATLMESARIVAEGAGAAALAGAVHLRDRLRGKRVACIVSGGNVTIDGIKRALDEERTW